MRRPLAALGALTLVLALSGCTLIQSLTSTFRPDSTVLPLVIGSCLDARNGQDSDRSSIVECDGPHLYEVTSIDQWPGMAAAITAADDDLGAVWDSISQPTGDGENADYWSWASRNCNEAAQRTVGIADVEVDGHTAADLWLRVGGFYGVDLSLGSREQFVAGDVATLCSMAWYDDLERPRMLNEPPFSEVLHPGFSPDLRECWAANYSVIPCDQPHAGQVMLEFEGLEAFGTEVIERAATGEATEEDWTMQDSFCEQLLLQTLPFSANLDDLGYLADISAGTSWDEYDGAVDTEGAYFYSCVAVGPQPDDMIVGDVFEGTATVDGSGSDA